MRILFSFSMIVCLFSLSCLADPTRPAQLNQTMSLATSQGGEPLQLRLIRWQEQQASVVINGQLLRAGDRIAGYQLQEIHQDHVVLESAADRLQLFIFQKMTHNDE